MCGSLSVCFCKVVKCTTLHLRRCKTNRCGSSGVSFEITHSGCRALVKVKGSVEGHIHSICHECCNPSAGVSLAIYWFFKQL